MAKSIGEKKEEVEFEKVPQGFDVLHTDLQNIDVPISSLVRIRVYEQTFETGTTDTTAENCTQEVQSDQVYAGNYSLKVTISAGQTGTITTPARPVSANQRVTFSFAHKEEGDITDVKLIVIWRRSSGGVISTEEFTLTPSTSWQVDSRTVVAPKQAVSMELRMQATAGSSEGYVYLDEMVMDLVGQILRVDGAGNVMVSVENTPLDVNVINTSLTVSGTVSVDNFPSEYPLPSSQISDLKSVTIEGSNIAYDSTADRLKVELPYDARDRNWALSSTTDSVTVTGSVDVTSLPSITGTVSVDNFPSEYPLPSTQVSDLKNVTVTSFGVAYDSATDELKVKLSYDARERLWTLSSDTDSVTVTGTINVGNFPTDYPDSTAHSKLDTINTTLSSELTRIAKVQYYDGTNWVDWDKTVSIDNFPSEYPLPSTQITELKNVTLTGSSIGYDSSTDKFKVDLGYDARDRNWNLSSDVDSVSVSGSVSVTNMPTDYAKESTLSSIDSKITTCDTSNISGTVNIGNWLSFTFDASNYLYINIGADSVGLAKESTLSSIDSKIVKVDTDNVTIVNFPSEYPLPSSQVNDLKNVTIVSSDIAYDSSTDRLKVILPYDARDRNWSLSSSTDSVSVTGSVSVSGTVNVGNFPSTYPLPETQVDEDTYFTGFVWDPSTSQFVRIEGYISNAEYGYDANGNLTSETLTITDATGTTIATIQKTYTYDAYGNLIGESKWEKV